MRRLAPILILIAVISTAIAGAVCAHAGERKSIRIGYVISLTGENATGARTTLLPNYRMWVADVNAAGGIMLSRIGKRLPIEVIEYDDESNAAGALRGIQRLVNKDKVDFILSPWGTGLNLAVAPLFHAAGYPQIVSAAIVWRAQELVKDWPNSFWLLGTTDENVQALIQVLSELRTQGKITSRIAMMSVADQFGIDLAKTARAAFHKAHFEVVYNRPYPVGSQDMRPALKEVMQSGAEVFIAFSYPPDTLLLTRQAAEVNFNPKIFFTAVGTAYPLLRDRFGANAEGVMGMGGWDGAAPASRAYLARHLAVTGQEPDRWASPVTYAGLQMLQQAIEHVGDIDREAVIKDLQTGTFQTIVGTVKLEHNFRRGVYGVGQWQHGEFYGVAPTTLPGARPIEFPKPAWSPE